MNGRDPSANGASSARQAGPQGTQLFSTEQLRRYAGEAEAVGGGRASANEPVLERVDEGAGPRRYSLRSGRQTIGRRGDNDIVVDEPSVSASHAWIVNQQGHYVVMNTLSTNGTFVNDKRVHEAPLRHGDRVRFGQAEFVFRTRERHVDPVAYLQRFAIAVLVLGGLGALAWWIV